MKLRKNPMRFLAIGVITAIPLLVSVPGAAASVTIGQLAAPNPAITCTANNFDDVQLTAAPATPTYTVPSTGGVTSWKVSSWSHQAGAGAGQELTLKIFRQVSGLNYQVVGHDGPNPLTPSRVNTFSVAGSLVVNAGDQLGLHNGIPDTACIFTGTAQDTRGFRSGDLADGATGTFSQSANIVLNISAVLDPVNTFTVGAVTRNKKKGTGSVAVTVTNPGTLTLSGGGSKGQTKSVSAAGTANLTIKAKGKKKKKKLNSTGKVKVSPTITYTPTGGTAATQGLKVKLKKRI